MNLALNPLVKSLRCSLTGTQYRPGDFDHPIGLCTCCDRPGKPLTIEYDYDNIASFQTTRPGLWRYAPLLPVAQVPDSYGADVGQTPLTYLDRLSDTLGLELFAKHERCNPSGSFKDRGLAIGIALGHALGAKRFCLPTQGNAGVAAAMFSARLQLPNALIYMPTTHRGTSYAQRAKQYGAEIRFFGDTLADSGKRMRRELSDELACGDYVDMSTFFEPGRLEGKKTMGFEIFEFFGENLPDYILYPTGGGTGLVGIWKAFAELRAMGVLGASTSLPKLVAVQSENCSPVVDAFLNSQSEVHPVVSKGTKADGLNVPGAIMGHGILKALDESQGLAIAISEAAITGTFESLNAQGISVSYESAATIAAAKDLRQKQVIPKGSSALALFTSGLLTSL